MSASRWMSSASPTCYRPGSGFMCSISVVLLTLLGAACHHLCLAGGKRKRKPSTTCLSFLSQRSRTGPELSIFQSAGSTLREHLLLRACGIEKENASMFFSGKIWCENIFRHFYQQLEENILKAPAYPSSP